jgi:hypothetical protein
LLFGCVIAQKDALKARPGHIEVTGGIAQHPPNTMSALIPKADTYCGSRNVRFVPKADKQG